MALRRRIFLILAFLLGPGSAESWGASFQDAMGRQVEVTDIPRRIVTLAPSLTEIVYSLGLGDRVVGVTRFSAYPPEVADTPKVGTYVDLNVERILSLSPDLVIGTADGNQRSVVELLERAGIPVFVVNPRDLRQVIRSVVEIGEVCGVPLTARSKAEELSARVDAIAQRVSGLDRPLVFLQVNSRPIMTVNGNTFSSDLIRLAGGRNMAADQPINYPRISREAVIEGRPEVIIISSMENGVRFEETRRRWLGLQMIPAARDGRVHIVDSNLIDRPSPRVVEGLEILARLIHPEATWDE